MSPILYPSEQQDYEQAIRNRGYSVDEFSWQLITNNNGIEQIRITRSTSQKIGEYEHNNPNSIAQNQWTLEFENDLQNDFYE
ncbi:TPA: hypothetical protein I8034_002395 [Legionella pneumophila]|nr:hypothetical protein [Legionella pneumophila subsp. fraseri]HAT1773016.1 hypothetical protein [Legionella pneumophila]MDX1847179.1 hypothetical protein [Legionella pneumophila subsp. fraseri]HAT2127903.1 hypothetical protein [Legionella pneumophila]HAT2136919.1 hypothetical protein [Legionella pneumophila]